MLMRHNSVALIALFCFLQQQSLICIAAESNDSASGSGVVSATNSGQSFEWTLEKMLMATAMPMTGEEREFLQSHKNLGSIQSWDLHDFQLYVSTFLGKKHAVEEAVHWRGIVQMLNKQAKAGAKYMHKQVPAGDISVNGLLTESYDDILKKLDNEVSVKQLFEQMSSWRKQIALLAPFVESMRKKAEAKGKAQEFEQAIE